MKETGIIMSGDHPRKILNGTKTQTRRVIKPQPLAGQGIVSVPVDLRDFPATWAVVEMADKPVDFLRYIKCPYGQVGQRLWVRETFWHPPIYIGDVSAGLIKKDTSIVSYKANLEPHQAERQIWKPSIFMPRWASRITLEITEVRVERLQEITLEDCKAEGIGGYTFARGCLSNNPPDPRWNFIELWDSLNAKRGYGWDMNPFVWCISFKFI